MQFRGKIFITGILVAVLFAGGFIFTARAYGKKPGSRSWKAPVSLFESTERRKNLLPWAVHEHDGKIYAVFIQSRSRRKFHLLVHRSEDQGRTFKETANIQLKNLSIPPALLLKGKRLLGVYADRRRRLYFMETNLDSGKSSDKVAIRLRGLYQADPFVWPVLKEIQGKLYYLCGKRARARTYLRLFLLVSENGGKKWRIDSPRSWIQKRRRGGRPVIYATRHVLHVMSRGTGEYGVNHYIKPLDGGKWVPTRDAFSRPNRKTVPLAAANNGKMTVVVYGSTKSYFTRSALYGVRSKDGVMHWDERIQLAPRIHTDYANFTRIATGKSGFLLATTRPVERESESGEDILLKIASPEGSDWRDAGLPGITSGNRGMPVAAFSKKGRKIYLLYRKYAPRSAKKFSMRILFRVRE